MLKKMLYLLDTNAWKGIRGYYQDLGVSIQSHSEDQVRVAEPLKTRLNTVKRRNP